MFEDHSLLARFSEGLVPVNVVSVEKLLKSIGSLNCIVVDQFNWTGLRQGHKVILTIDDKRPFSYTSKHVVFFAKMKIVGTTTSRKVIMKFHVVNESVVEMTRPHCDSIINNYKKLDEYLKIATCRGKSFDNINVAAMCILVTESRTIFHSRKQIHLWIEEYIDGYRKFTHVIDNPWKIPKIQLETIISTDERALFELQAFIFDESSRIHTICDLQGSCVNQQYVLSDIEFTNTLGKYGYHHRELLQLFKRIYDAQCALQEGEGGIIGTGGASGGVGEWSAGALGPMMMSRKQRSKSVNLPPSPNSARMMMRAPFFSGRELSVSSSRSDDQLIAGSGAGATGEVDEVSTVFHVMQGAVDIAEGTALFVINCILLTISNALKVIDLEQISLPIDKVALYLEAHIEQALTPHQIITLDCRVSIALLFMVLLLKEWLVDLATSLFLGCLHLVTNSVMAISVCAFLVYLLAMVLVDHVGTKCVMSLATIYAVLRYAVSQDTKIQWLALLLLLVTVPIIWLTPPFLLAFVAICRLTGTGLSTLIIHFLRWFAGFSVDNKAAE